MKKKWKFTGLIVVLVPAVACLVIWVTFRNPYESKYFTPEIQAKYLTVESVLDAWCIGWKSDTPEHIELVNEVYGFSVADSYDKFSGSQQGEMEEIGSISYSEDRQLAFVLTERSGWTFITRGNRWVFYPETPWVGFVEMVHGGYTQNPEHIGPPAKSNQG